jgi:hypothetical protein
MLLRWGTGVTYLVGGTVDGMTQREVSFGLRGLSGKRGYMVAVMPDKNREHHGIMSW